jgi:hypothetical protein
MRRFEFEADMYEALLCVPMVVRERLDRAAIKISHQQWLALELSERRLICELSVDTDRQLPELSDLINRLVLERSGTVPTIMSSEQQLAAFPSLELPAHLAANARALGIELSQKQWTLLDQDERYVLMKLGGGQRVKRNFEAALNEFLQDENGFSPEPRYDSRQG